MSELLPITTPQPEAATNDWRNDAKCRIGSCNPDMFFPNHNKGEHADAAIEFCSNCLVQNQCLTYAVKNKIEDGIWGGTTPETRKKLSRRSKNTQTRHRIHKNS